MGGCASAVAPEEGLSPADRKNFGADPPFEDLEHFDLPKDVIYFDSATRTLKHRAAVNMAKQALEQSMQVEMKAECKKLEIKEMFAKIVNGKPEDVAMFPCVSHCMSMLALNLGDQLVEGNKIVLVRGLSSSSSIPWLELCKRECVKFVFVDNPDDLLTTDMEDVKVVTTFHCRSSDGSMTNLIEVKKRCDAVGAYLIVDASESIGAMEFDIQKIKPHAVCSSAHKWLGGMHGTTLMWLDPQFHKGLSPLDHNEGNRKNPGDGLGDEVNSNELLDSAARLDAGGKPNPILLPTLHASMQQILKWGIENIEDHTGQLTQQVAVRATDHGMRVKEKHASHIVAISYPGKDGKEKTERLYEFLAERKIYTSLCSGAIIIGVWVYNNGEDVRGFFDAVHEFENPHCDDDEKKVEVVKTRTKTL